MARDRLDYTAPLLGASIALHLSFIGLTIHLLGGSGWALAYLVAYPLVFLYFNVWFACAGCPKYGRTCVMIPFGGKLAATFFRRRPSAPSRADKAVSFLLTLALTSVAVVSGAHQRRWVLFTVALGLNLCHLLLWRATVSRVFDGWGRF